MSSEMPARERVRRVWELLMRTGWKKGDASPSSVSAMVFLLTGTPLDVHERDQVFFRGLEVLLGPALANGLRQPPCLVEIVLEEPGNVGLLDPEPPRRFRVQRPLQP